MYCLSTTRQDTLSRKLKTKKKDGTKKMNDYEMKIEAKKRRYSELAKKAETTSEAEINKAKRLSSAIPFGQPILVGHHSEKRHRSHLNKINQAYDKAFEEGKKAEYYAGKAEGYGTHGISSDNPNAVKELEEKLEGLIKKHELMIRVNKIQRAFLKNPGTLNSADISDGLKERIRTYKPEYSFDTAIYPKYAISNSSQNIASVKKRIESVSVVQTLPDVTREYEGYTYKEEECRVQFVFDTIPNPEIRTVLKAQGFKWSPTRKAWVRMLNSAGRYAAKRVIELITRVV